MVKANNIIIKLILTLKCNEVFQGYHLNICCIVFSLGVCIFDY